ncbi:Cyclic pyranopterin monophosphate synthase accessory protein 1 [Pirellulimonas nuda]|uniref:cyclic pyranopterin monophosphate synthase n=2 Tax=Pirellulimonas nuda TaxID=2528009 RepID=A0A518DGH3_9BACT|nr:Cyclic pyranopterin monophosphate synthase accessory protein 1 [Pirellulimonas nuda]
MVDVGAKPVSRRRAVASGLVRMLPESLQTIRDRESSKGDVLEIARLAGIMAAKKTADLIPLCHPLALESVEVSFEFMPPDLLQIRSVALIESKTGVEMEALTAVSVAALTVYDMLKGVDRGMTIERLNLEEKSGGVSGEWRRPAPAN